MERFEDNKDWIIQHLRQCNDNGNTVPKDIVHIIFMLLAVSNLSVAKDVEHNVQQLMERLVQFDPNNSQQADMLWNFFAIGLLSDRSHSFRPQKLAQWQALIPNYASLNMKQRVGYCIGQALIINKNNADAWLHLAVVFNNLALDLSDLPPELIPLFKRAISVNPNPSQCALFCCNQVFDNKHNDELYNRASRLKRMIETKLNATRIQSVPMSGASVSIASPFLSLRYVKPPLTATPAAKPIYQSSAVATNGILRQPTPEVITPVPVLRNEQRTVFEKLMERAEAFKIQGNNIKALFTDDLTIADAKNAISNVECLIKILKAIRPQAIRHTFIYALFTHPEHTKRNSANSPRDEEFIKKIIKTKEDFEKILAVLPPDTKTFHVRSTTEKKYLKSPHVARLCQAQKASHDRPLAFTNPAHVPATLFVPRPILNRRPLHWPPVAPVYNAVEVEFVDLTEKPTPSAHVEGMEIEPVIATVVKRERENDEESAADERANKRPKF